MDENSTTLIDFNTEIEGGQHCWRFLSGFCGLEVLIPDLISKSFKVTGILYAFCATKYN
jgi:hypothetical protein